MQKIIIKNFGPISEAEIILNQMVVIIGEQASGKSTVAKLIYFFKSLREDLFNTIYNKATETKQFKFDYTTCLIIPTREKFYDFFGSTYHMKDFEIIFYYDIDKSLTLKLNKKTRKLDVTASNGFNWSAIQKIVANYQYQLPQISIESDPHELLAYSQEKIKYAEQLSSIIKDLFCCEQEDNLFIVAGRNTSVGYPESFEQSIIEEANKNIEASRSHSFRSKTQTVDETLMIDFIKKMRKIKAIFKKNGSLIGYIESLDKQKKKTNAYFVLSVMESILKGKYKIDEWGEKIFFDDTSNEYIYLHNASSGQQEIIRILQDVLVSISNNSKVFRVIEEPEAHLFPVGQKKVIELLAMLSNNSPSNQIIVTTHSPYVLTTINNLLFAYRIINKYAKTKDDICKTIGENSLLNSLQTSVYCLKRNEDNMIKSYDIMEPNTGLISQNNLDIVSEQLSNEFNTIYSVYANTITNNE